MSIYKVITLSELIRSQGEDKVQQFLMGFECKRNQDIENFLIKKAIRFENALVATTYLILGEQGLLGYFSLSFKSINVDISRNLLKKINVWLNQK